MLKKLLFLTILLLSLVLLKPVFAQTQKGISVTPSIMHIDLEQDGPEYLLTYKNTTKTDVTLELRVQDFNELEESYKINYLEGKDASNYKYSLSSWISFENKTIQLSPGEEKSVKIFIDKNRITKGGHYASILAQVLQSEGEKQVDVKAILGSLLFVRASTGKEVETGKISTLRPSRDGIEYPSSYVWRFENSGNVHVIPYGLLEIYDPLGNLAAKGILNEDSLDALPESIRRYETKVTTYQKVLLPGIYTAKISVHFGKTNEKVSASVKFFSQGGLDLVKIVPVLLAIIGIIWYFKRRKRTKI